MSDDVRNDLLSNVWCGKCRHEVTITKYKGVVRSGDLLLLGSCAECHGDLARAIDFEDRDDGTYAILGQPKLTAAESMQEMELLPAAAKLEKLTG